MTLIVNQLETYDKSNLEVIRLEFAKLQKKLEDCQRQHDFIKPDIGESASQKMVDNSLHCRSFSTFFFLFQATAITQES